MSEAAGRPRSAVRRLGDDRYRLELGSAERRIIGALAAELATATAGGADLADPAYRRLYPVMRPDDADAEARLQAMVRADLEAGRRRQLEIVEATLEADDLDASQLSAWLGVCNDLRLVIAARLGVIGADDGDVAIPDDPDDPDAWPLVVYHFLGWLVGEIVEVLDAGLPEDPAAPPT